MPQSWPSGYYAAVFPTTFGDRFIPFIVREDGVVISAGRYLNFDEDQELDLPLGLGARHMAAAGISRDTQAIAIVVSQTSGSVRVFRHGKVALELAPRGRRS